VDVTGGGSPNTAVQKFTNNGTFITSWARQVGKFISPGWVTVDSVDKVYVGDFGENNHIQKFERDGNYITKWGTSGPGDGQFSMPAGLAIDSSGNILVVDGGNNRNNRIQKFDGKGKFIMKWGTSGAGDGQFEQPTGIAIDPLGNV
jgi:DNA-binding beta-propeller fold protein YncE